MNNLSLLSRSWKTSSRKQMIALWFCTAVVIALAVPRIQKNVSASSSGGGPTIWLQQPHTFAATYQGDADAAEYLTSGQATPLSLATADFNEDGVADVAVGYSAGQGGLLVIHAGNLDAISPQSIESWNAIASGQYPLAFLNTATVVSLPAAPDFLASARTSGSHTDLLVAAAGSNVITVLNGNGQGKFEPGQSIDLPGAITALAAGEFGPHGGFHHVLVGVKGAQQSSLLVYAGSAQGLTLQSSVVLPNSATAIALGDLDGDALPDAAVLAGGQVFLLHSVVANDEPALQPLNLSLSASALALGRFVFDRDPRQQMALLTPDGAVHVAVHSAFNPQFWTANELKTMQKNRAHRSATPAQPSLTEGWTVAESVAGIAPYTDASHPPLLLSLRNSGYAQDDIVALNGEAAQMAMISHPNLKLGAATFIPAQSTVRAYTEGTPVAVTAMRVNADGRKGMVVLHQGQIGPLVMEPLPDPTFTVNTTADTVDANPGDGKCADAQGNCSLRAAIMEANADSGVDTIVVPAGTFTLTIPPNSLGNASGGHLDITDGVNIIGASMSTTIIQAGTSASNGIDKVFSINPNGMDPSFDALLSNMTIQFGLNNGGDDDPFGGGFDWDAGTNGTGNITLSDVNLNSNSVPISSTEGGGDGGGALFSDIIGGTTGTVTITNSTIQSNIAQDAGGGIWVGSTVPLTITNTQVLNNQAVGSGAQTGGGILVFGPSGASQSTIQSSTISGNQAGVQGAGIYTTEGLLINQGTVITGNQSSGDGGGLWSNLTNDTTTLTGITITSNTATGHGGGIEVDNSSIGNNLVMTYSRVVSNSAGTGSGLNNADGTVTATDDWWGCNTGPSATPCNLVTGTVTSGPWLTLSNTANPSAIAAEASTTLTASFLQDSSGATISASNLGALIGVPVTFGNATNGTLSSAQTSIQSTGTATATFTATAGPTASASATVDSATVTADVNVSAFTVTISPASQTVLAGTSVSYTVTVAPVGSFSGTVTLSTSGCPANATCSLSTTSIPNASGTSTLTVATTSSTATNNFPLTVTGTSGGTVVSGSATLSVQNFAMVVTPATQTVNPGFSVAYTVTVTRMNGFTGTVTLTVSGLPTGASGTFSSTSLGGRTTSSTLTVCTSSATAQCQGTTGVTPAANSTLTVTGASGGQSRTTTAALDVTDFSISVSPTSVTVNPGGSATYTVTVTPINGFTGNVALTLAGLPAGGGDTFNPSTVTITSGAATSTLTVTTTSGTTPAATSSLPITGTAASGDAHSTTATLVVQDFSITPPSLACINAASSTSGTVTLAGLNGFIGSVSLSVSSGLPAGATASFSPNPVSITGSGNFTSTLSISTTSATPGGNSTLTITAVGTDSNNSGTVTHTATVTLCVENFTISISPTSVSLNAGATASYTVTVTPVNGFTGTVTLGQNGLPSGATPTFSPTSFTFTASNDGAQTSTLSVSTTSTLAGSSYPFTVSGTDGSLVQSVAATLNVKNFTLTISPTTESIVAGTSASYNVTATPVNGYTGTLDCTVTGLASGETANCPNITISGTTPVTVTLTISSLASTGASNVVFTAAYKDTTGNPSHSVTATLITEDFTIVLSPPSQPVDLNSSVTYTVTAQPVNGFTGTINITCSISPTGPTIPSSNPCPTSLTITNGNPVSASFMVSTSQSNTTGQNYTVTAKGTSAAVPSLSNSGTATLQAEDFGLTISASQGVTVGGSASYTVTANSINGFSGNVLLTCTGTLAGANVTCSPGSVSVPANGSASSTLTVTTSGSTVAGSFSVQVSATGDGITHSASSTISVTDQRSLIMLGSVDSALGSSCCYTFSVTVNSFTASASYCECESNGQFQDNPAALVSQLVTAFGASGSPVTAAAYNDALGDAGLTLTAKSPGVVLSISSSDTGAASQGLSPSFMTIPVGGAQGTISLTITGSIVSGSPAANGNPEPFSVAVNGFTATADYCQCSIGGQIVNSPGALAIAVATAINASSSSPVTASGGSSGVLVLTSKTANAPLSGVVGVDGDPQGGGMSGYSFTATPPTPP